MTEKDTELRLIIRECEQCDHRAVPLEGEGTECVECDGEYGRHVGTRIVEVTKVTAFGMRKSNPKAIDN